MRRCKALALSVCVCLLAAIPAFGQRGTFGIDVGQSSDKFGALPAVNGLMVGIDGQIAILKSKQKEGGASVVVGGEIRLPSDTASHAKEFAIYGGPAFQVRSLSIGVNAQIRKIILPSSTVNNQIFVRDKMELLEIPLVIKYAFGASQRAYIQAEGAPEFSPRFRAGGSTVILPNPNFDHGYFVRGTAGYTFGKWYAKVSYENRYFKFLENAGNPTNLYNWRTNLISGGVGFAF